MVPFMMAAISFLAGTLGIRAALDAKKKFNTAGEIVEDSKQRYKQKELEVCIKRQDTYEKLVELGMVKKQVFENKGKKLIKLIKNSRSSAEIKFYELQEFISVEIPEIEKEISKLSVFEFSSDTTKSIATAYLATAGLYKSVTMFGTASTGTAISTLSGAAAEKATLAWFGGGSLAKGGFGVAGGTWVLGGFFTGISIAILGFLLNKKAEKKLTEAVKYREDINKAIADMEQIIVMLYGIDESIVEVKEVLENLSKAFDTLYRKYKIAKLKSLLFFFGKKKEELKTEKQKLLLNMVSVFKTIRNVVNEPLLDEYGVRIAGLKEKWNGVFIYRTQKSNLLNLKIFVRNLYL